MRNPITKKLRVWLISLIITYFLTITQAQPTTTTTNLELNHNAILKSSAITHMTTGSDNDEMKITPLKGDKAAQAATMFFLVLALLDYLIYFGLFFYVFMFVVTESKTIFKAIFSFLVTMSFSGIRMVFLPLILNSIPYSWAPKFPTLLIEVSFYACTISYIVFFNAPVMACLYFVIKFGFGGDKLKSGILDHETQEVPMVVIMMPIYNEEPIPLFRAVESAIRSDYPHDRLHLILAFDDAKESSLYWALLKRLKVLNKEVQEQWRNEMTSLDDNEDERERFLFPPRLELMVEGVRMTICRFPHEGKSATQGKGFQIVNEIYGQSELSIKSTFLMFIDSDVILHDNAVYNFVATLVSKPKMNAVTGYITCRTSDNTNLFHYLQDSEYLEGQMFARSLEALSGSVTCLPGALTLLRLKTMQAVAPKYFIEFDKRKPLNFHRFYLGEDRYMTHLLMEQSDQSHTIGLCGASRCKTDAPDDWQKLIKQRRRWYLGALINEAHMLCTPKLWRTMPLLLSLKLFDYASGSLSWLFLVYVVGVIKGVVPGWTIAVFFPCLVLKYLILSINASFMNRTKIFITFPIFFFLSPIFKMYCTIYSMFTWDTRSWGGPRTDVIEAEVSSVEVMDELMKMRRLNSVKRSKKMLKQMRLRSKIVNLNLESEKTLAITYSLDSPNPTITPTTSTPHHHQEKDQPKDNGAIPIKRILPFPFRVDILGGGEYFTDLIYPDMIPRLINQSYSPSPSSPHHTTLDLNDLPSPSSFHSDLRTSFSSNSTDHHHPSPHPITIITTSIPTHGSHTPSSSLDGSLDHLSVDETKYVYGRYQKSHPNSVTSIMLDVPSLTRLDQLARSHSAGPLPTSSSSSPTHYSHDPTSLSYRLTTTTNTTTGISPRPSYQHQHHSIPITPPSLNFLTIPTTTSPTTTTIPSSSSSTPSSPLHSLHPSSSL